MVGCCAEEDGCILGLENEQLKAKADKYGYRFHAPVTMQLISDDGVLDKWSLYYAELRKSQRSALQAAAGTINNVP